LKILILLSRVPYPTEKGDKLRAFNHLRYLSRNNDIILCALNNKPLHPDALQQIKPFCSKINIIKLNWWEIITGLVWALFAGKPFQVGYFYSHLAKRKIEKIVKETAPDHIFCQLIRTAEYIRTLNIPKTLDYQDVLSTGYKRRAAQSGFLYGLIFMFEHWRLLRYEKAVFDDFDCKTIISIPDRDLIPHPRRMEIEVIPNGVDFDFFRPMDVQKDYHIVFTGNMNYPPNVDAACFLIKEILPLIRKTHPDIKVLLAGASPHSKVLGLKSDRVIVTGWVPDLRVCYASAKIFIAPMQIGTGLQNKLLEAMAMGLPCITSPLANNALGAKDGKEILIGNSPDKYASQINRLLTDNEFAGNIARNGRDFVLRTHNWQQTTDRLYNFMRQHTPSSR
jgi:sugar transferase (PEP-CTERM/EpsH1 system associated)